MRKLKIKNEINETLRDKIKYPLEKIRWKGLREEQILQKRILKIKRM